MLLYEQLAQELALQIGEGVMRSGDRLPSVRHLATQRGLSISTVLQALRTLESQGVVEARPQSGYYVRHRVQRAVSVAPAGHCGLPVDVGLSQRLMHVLKVNDAPGVVPLGAALPAAQWLVPAQLNRLYASIARRHPHLLAGSSHSDLNEGPLVDSIVQRARQWGWFIRPDELVITNSCTEALAVCLRSVTQPGDTVAVESPTYYVMLQLLEALGLKALEIPTHPVTGVSVDALELATREGKVAAVLLIPNGLNPTGSVMPDEHKAAVAQLLSERKVPLIEDDVYGEVCFTRERPRTLHSFDTTGNTLLCSSFSKTASPALRLGYVAAGRRVEKVMLQKTLTSGKTNPLTQRVAAELIATRGYDAHLRSLRRRYAQQIIRAQDAVSRHFPEGTCVSDPKGGLVLWIELPEPINTTRLHEKAIEKGIAYVPGELFCASGRYLNYLRLSCGRPWTEAMDKAVEQLGQMFKQALEESV